jgi:hypothetical protein
MNQESRKKPLIFSISYTLYNLVSIMPGEVIFQTAGLFSPSNIKKRKFDSKKRQNPVQVIYGETDQKNIVIRFPKNWTLQSDLKNYEFSNKYGSASIEYNHSKNEIVVNLVRNSKRASGGKEEISDLMEILSSQSKVIVPDIIFNTHN